MTVSQDFTAALPPIALAVVDDFARQLAPLSWSDRTLAFEALWNDVILSPRDDAPAAPVWRAIVTGAFERLRITKIKNLDAAAWALLTLDPQLRQAGENFLRKHAAAFVTWGQLHVLHEIIAEAIDAAALPSPATAIH